MEARHQLAAIVFTDAVGSSQSMREDEERTLGLLHEDLNLMREVCEQHGGEVLKSTGDGLMMLFKSASQAVLCGLDIQQRIGPAEKGTLQHRIGIHLGDVYLSEGDAHGDGVNVAARLQELASPGCICLSKTVLDVARSRLRLQPKAIGVRQLKGIDEGIEIFEIAPGGKPQSKPQTRRTPGGLFLPAFGMVLTAAVAIAALVTRPWETRQEATMPIPPPTKTTSIDPSQIHSDLEATRKTAEEAKRLADQANKSLAKTAPGDSAKNHPTPVAAPQPPASPEDAPDLSSLDSENADSSTLLDPDKFTKGVSKTVEEALKTVPPSISAALSSHAALKGYVEQAASHWKSRDFASMVDWIHQQPWASSAEGKKVLRHWTLMSDFKSWYLSQMRLYSPGKPLSAVRKNGDEIQAWVLPGDLIAYQRGTEKVHKGGFEQTPLWLISATLESLLGDSQEPKRLMLGFVGMQIEQHVQKTQDPAEAG